jgi:hypothetical protein
MDAMGQRLNKRTTRDGAGLATGLDRLVPVCASACECMPGAVIAVRSPFCTSATSATSATSLSNMEISTAACRGRPGRQLKSPRFLRVPPTVPANHSRAFDVESAEEAHCSLPYRHVCFSASTPSLPPGSVSRFPAALHAMLRRDPMSRRRKAVSELAAMGDHKPQSNLRGLKEEVPSSLTLGGFLRAPHSVKLNHCASSKSITEPVWSLFPCELSIICRGLLASSSSVLLISQPRVELTAPRWRHSATWVAWRPAK